MMDIITVEGIISSLTEPDYSGKIHLYETLESTNATAKEMAKTGAEHGTVVLAETQTAGRGQFGKSFHSPPGHGIYLSIVLRPEVCPESLYFSDRTFSTLLAAIKVCEAIEAVSEKKPKTKWVNDIYLENKKICGILVESAVAHTSGKAEWMVIGIGINFNTPQSVFTEELRPVAGSLFSGKAPPIARNHLISEILSRLLTPTEQYDQEMLVDKYIDRLMRPEDKEHVLNEIKKYTFK